MVCVIYSVIESVVSEKKVLLSDGDVNISVGVAEGSHSEWGKIEAEILGRALSNLLSNSIEAFAGQTNLFSKSIFVLLSRTDGGWLRVTVQDNAGGLPEHVLEPYDLGLAQVRDTMSSMGGKLEMLSVEDVGTVINLLIPAVTTQAQ